MILAASTPNPFLVAGFSVILGALIPLAIGAVRERQSTFALLKDMKESVLPWFKKPTGPDENGNIPMDMTLPAQLGRVIAEQDVQAAEIREIKLQFRTNGGSSVRDQLNTIQTAVAPDVPIIEGDVA